MDVVGPFRCGTREGDRRNVVGDAEPALPIGVEDGGVAQCCDLVSEHPVDRDDDVGDPDRGDHSRLKFGLELLEQPQSDPWGCAVADFPDGQGDVLVAEGVVEPTHRNEPEDSDHRSLVVGDVLRHHHVQSPVRLAVLPCEEVRRLREDVRR